LTGVFCTHPTTSIDDEKHPGLVVSRYSVWLRGNRIYSGPFPLNSSKAVMEESLLVWRHATTTTTIGYNSNSYIDESVTYIIITPTTTATIVRFGSLPFSSLGTTPNNEDSS
jgi:hypothetical protein